MIAQVMGCAQGQMSQWTCGNLGSLGPMSLSVTQQQGWGDRPCFEEQMPSMWSTLWNESHICKSFKSCWIKSCYRRPTKPRSVPGETVPLWCATPCGNISAGWNCGRVKSATAGATRDRCKPTRKREVGKRRPRGRKNSARPDSPRGHSALPVCRARQETAGSRAHPRQCHRIFIHGHGCAGHFDDSRRAVGGGSE